MQNEATSDSYNEARINRLLKMHDFYSQEARHQRSMMWETVKWFTPILSLLLGFWGKYMIDFLACVSRQLGFLLVSAALFGIMLSIIASKLLESFYRTNLKYVTMFVKVEDELAFDNEKREKRQSYRNDEHITFEKYLDDRNITYTSAASFVTQAAPSIQKMLWNDLKHYMKYRKWPQTGRMYFWMTSVFYLFFLIFAVALISVIYVLIRYS